MNKQLVCWMSFLEFKQNLKKEFLNNGTIIYYSFANIYEKQNNILYEIINKKIIGIYHTKYFQLPNNQLFGKQYFKLFNNCQFTAPLYSPDLYINLGNMDIDYIVDLYDDKHVIIKENVYVHTEARFAFVIIHIDEYEYK